MKARLGGRMIKETRDCSRYLGRWHVPGFVSEPLLAAAAVLAYIGLFLATAVVAGLPLAIAVHFGAAPPAVSYWATLWTTLAADALCVGTIVLGCRRALQIHREIWVDGLVGAAGFASFALLAAWLLLCGQTPLY